MLVEVSKFTFPADFVILEMKEDNKVPFILRRYFLHTTDAKIRVKHKQLNLGVRTERMIFHIDSVMEHSYLNDDTCFGIGVIDEILEEDSDALLDEGSKILHSIEGTILEEKLFSEFDEFIAMNTDENFKSESNTEEPQFEKITFNTDYKIKTSLEEPLTDIELKHFPDNLEYVFLEEPSFLPVFEAGLEVDKAKIDVISKLPPTTNIKAQQNYTITEKELKAVVFAFDKFRSYLVLSKTIMHTDHSALRHLFKKQDVKPRLIRWILLLQEFDIGIKDRKGTENITANHLSQIENDETSDDSEVDNNFLGENLMKIDTKDEPWFTDFAKFGSLEVTPSSKRTKFQVFIVIGKQDRRKERTKAEKTS
ncbi:reverse transcriptase domain-containing protein, partial [Tanacetum coccineum]